MDPLKNPSKTEPVFAGFGSSRSDLGREGGALFSAATAVEASALFLPESIRVDVSFKTLAELDLPPLGLAVESSGSTGFLHLVFISFLIPISAPFPSLEGRLKITES